MFVKYIFKIQVILNELLYSITIVIKEKLLQGINLFHKGKQKSIYLPFT